MSGSYYDQAILSANRYGVPANLFTAIIGAESNWNPNAYNSSSGASGFGQVLGSTAANPGYGIQPLANPFDPNANLDFSAQYLAAQYSRTGSWMGATQAYSGSGSALPYAGNSQQANVLAAINNPGASSAMPTNSLGGGGGSSPTSLLSGASGASGSSSGSWVDTLLAKLGALASRAALLVIGLILLFGAIMIFAKQSER